MFFVSGSASFVIFCRSSVLRVAVGKIFGSELLFLSVVVGLVFFDSVLPRLLFYYLVFRSRKCLGKMLLMSGLLFEKIFGSELLFFGVGVGRVCFFCAVLPMFLLYYFVFRSRKCLEKILLTSGLVFLGFLDWLAGVFRGGFSGPEMPHFCCPKTACEKFSLS